MKTVTNNFKEEIRKLGREIDFKIFLYANDKLITQNNNFIITQDNLNLVVEQFNQEEIEYTINSDEIYNVSVVNRGELLSTMMKEVDFEVSKELKVGDVISCEFGLKVGNSYEYVDYGKYMIYEKEFNEDTKTYSYVAYDRMLLTMREIPNPSNFENKNILSVIQEICTITNLEFNGTSQTALTYPNLNKVINQGTFTDLVMTYRDMLDMICQALGLSMVVEDNELVLKDINEKERTFVGKNSLYLEDVMEGNALGYSVDGASEQNGTPTPSSPQEVKTIPSIINLFDKDNVTRGYRLTQDGKGTPDTNYYVSPWIKIEPNTTYTKNSPTADAYHRMCFYTSADTNTFISRNENNTATSPSNAQYMRICGLQTELDTTMIEEGTVAHEYVPYGYYTRVKVTGKNLFNNNVPITSNGIVSTYNDDGSISYSGQASSNWADLTARTFCMIPAGTTLTFSIDSAKNVGVILYFDKSNTDRMIIPIGSTSVTLTTTVAHTQAKINIDSMTSGTSYSGKIYPQLEEGTTATSYEQYKEKEVLIDMSKENLFDKNNPNVLNAYINAYKVITSSEGDRTVYIPCKPNTTYTITKSLSTPTNQNKFRVSTYSDIPSNGDTGIDYIGYSTGTEVTAITLTTSSTANYLAIFCWNTSSTSTFDEMLNSLNVYESNNPTPYYELCSTGDNKDRLVIDSTGNCVINKKIGKVVLNGSENWAFGNAGVTNINGASLNIDNMISSNYGDGYSNYFHNDKQGKEANSVRFGANNTTIYFYVSNDDFSSNTNWKNWLSTHNTDVYYVLATPETINLPNTQIPLFEGINHITLIDDLETDTSVVYYSSDLAVEEIDETYLNDTNVSFRKKYGPINSVVLSRSEDYDTIYRRDEESIEKNGLCEYKIKDNPILLYNDREEYIDEIFNQLKGIEYYPNDYLSKGITFLDWLDFYNVKIGDNTYKCLMLNDEIKVEQGLEESVYSEIPEETVTDYKTSSKTDKEVSFIVDKQNGNIKGIANQINFKVDKGDVINEINLDETGASINAEKISLAGKTIEMTSDNIAINSTNFNVDKNGNVTANNLKATNGEFSGEINATTGSISGWSIDNSGINNGVVFLHNDGSSTIYTVADLIIIRGYIMGTEGFNLSSDMIKHYDMNNDGVVNAQDYQILQNLIGIRM